MDMTEQAVCVAALDLSTACREATLTVLTWCDTAYGSSRGRIVCYGAPAFRFGFRISSSLRTGSLRPA